MNSHKIWSFLGLMTKEDKKNMDSSIERLQNTLDDIQKSISLIQEQDKKSIAEMKEYRELLENRFESTSNLNAEGFDKLEEACDQITKLINGVSKNIDSNGEQVNVNLGNIQKSISLIQEQDERAIAEMKEYRELLENRFESISNLNIEGFDKLEEACDQITKLINGASKNIDNNGEQVNVNLDIIQELLKLLVVNELIEYVPKRK